MKRHLNSTLWISEQNLKTGGKFCKARWLVSHDPQTFVSLKILGVSVGGGQGLL